MDGQMPSTKRKLATLDENSLENQGLTAAAVEDPNSISHSYSLRSSVRKRLNSYVQDSSVPIFPKNKSPRKVSPSRGPDENGQLNPQAQNLTNGNQAINDPQLSLSGENEIIIPTFHEEVGIQDQIIDQEQLILMEIIESLDERPTEGIRKEIGDEVIEQNDQPDLDESFEFEEMGNYQENIPVPQAQPNEEIVQENQHVNQPLEVENGVGIRSLGFIMIRRMSELVRSLEAASIENGREAGDAPKQN